MDDHTEQFLSSLPPNFGAGTARAVNCSLRTVKLTDGSVLDFPTSGVTAIVGPNNAGKSTLLKELYSAIGLSVTTTITSNSRVVADTELTVSGTHVDALAWLMGRARIGRAQRESGGLGLMPLGPGQHLDADFVTNRLPFLWAGASSGRLGGELRPFFVHYADTEARLLQSRAAPARDDARQVATHPLHALADDRSRLTRASTLAEEVFGEPLHLDDYSAAHRLKVGQIRISPPQRGSEDGTYRNALLALPELSEARRRYAELFWPSATISCSYISVNLRR